MHGRHEQGGGHGGGHGGGIVEDMGCMDLQRKKSLISNIIIAYHFTMD